MRNLDRFVAGLIACSLWWSAPSALFAGEVAFIGDSLSTGGVAHQDLYFDWSELLSIFSGKKPLVPTQDELAAIREAGFALEDQPAPPRRLGPTQKEFRGGLMWVFSHAAHVFSSRYLDMEEYSWDYLLARDLGYQPSDILIAADDGARLETAPRQIDRVLEATGGEIPERVFFFFSGNDICGATPELITSSELFGKQLEESLRYLMRRGRSSEAGADVWIVDPLSVAQVAQSPAILAKTVSAHGQTMTCSELQKYRKPPPVDFEELMAYGPEAAYLIQQFPRSPADLCPTLFARGDEVRTRIANTIRNYRKEIKRVVDKLNVANVAGKGIDAGNSRVRFHQLVDTGPLLFEAADIAGDCFHLSARGHAKVARLVRDEMQRGGQ